MFTVSYVVCAAKSPKECGPPLVAFSLKSSALAFARNRARTVADATVDYRIFRTVSDAAPPDGSREVAVVFA